MQTVGLTIAAVWSITTSARAEAPVPMVVICASLLATPGATSVEEADLSAVVHEVGDQLNRLMTSAEKRKRRLPAWLREIEERRDGEPAVGDLTRPHELPAALRIVNPDRFLLRAIRPEDAAQMIGRWSSVREALDPERPAILSAMRVRGRPAILAHLRAMNARSEDLNLSTRTDFEAGEIVRLRAELRPKTFAAKVDLYLNTLVNERYPWIEYQRRARDAGIPEASLDFADFANRTSRALARRPRAMELAYVGKSFVTSRKFAIAALHDAENGRRIDDPTIVAARAFDRTLLARAAGADVSVDPILMAVDLVFYRAAGDWELLRVVRAGQDPRGPRGRPKPPIDTDLPIPDEPGLNEGLIWGVAR